MYKFLVLLLVLAVTSDLLSENKTDDENIIQGLPCMFKKTGSYGLCTNIDHCDYAKNLLKLKKWRRPQQCEGFIGVYPLVCCPAPRSAVACRVYYPPPNPDDVCLQPEILGGKKTVAREYPHMAALGYGEINDIKWFCGGSLISDQFILTAAHCIKTKNYGTVRWVRLGDLDLASGEDERTGMSQPQHFAVAQTYRHPEYNPPSHYHDIALVKLDRAARFSPFVAPACLHTELPVPNELSVTGWGQTGLLGGTSNYLLKADIFYVNHTKCATRHSTISRRRLPNGILNHVQVCAGHPEGKDTCPGDSGGPLQYKLHEDAPHFQIIGVTSFGQGCGGSDSVAVYTRVSAYLPWIQDIVWPAANFTLI